jgi:hypothetical protein
VANTVNSLPNGTPSTLINSVPIDPIPFNSALINPTKPDQPNNSRSIQQTQTTQSCMLCGLPHPSTSCDASEAQLRLALDNLRYTTTDCTTLKQKRELLKHKLRQHMLASMNVAG